jgi:hypothetical protein
VAEIEFPEDSPPAFGRFTRLRPEHRAVARGTARPSVESIRRCRKYTWRSGREMLEPPTSGETERHYALGSRVAEQSAEDFHDMRTHGVLAVLVLTGSICAMPQESKSRTPERNVPAATQSDKSDEDTTVIYGRIKEVKAGKKVVVAVDKALDKTYDLTDGNATVRLAEDLAIGDRVKVMEHGKKGNKSVQIVRDVSSGNNQQDRAKPANPDK